MMDKRADIPVTILVIGVVGICILTILSFVKFNADIDKDFLGIGLIETINSISEEIDFNTENLEFEDNYGNNFTSGNVEITVNGKNIKGSYYKEECFYMFFGCENKRIVFVEYVK